MYAIFENGGKQYRVSEGDVVYLEKLQAEAGETVSFKEVLVVGGAENMQVGAPYVNATITGTVLGQGKAKKIIVFKYKAKKNYRRKQGHRQPYTKIAIDKISID